MFYRLAGGDISSADLSSKSPVLSPSHVLTLLDAFFLTSLIFQALNFQGRLKFLRGQNERTKDGKPIPPQLALFALASPLQPPSILEIRTKNLIFRTKHKLDFTPTACDAKWVTDRSALVLYNP